MIDEDKKTIIQLREALQVAKMTIENLRTAESSRPCPKDCGDCCGQETGCYILRTIGAINRALDRAYGRY